MPRLYHQGDLWTARIILKLQYKEANEEAELWDLRNGHE